MHKEKIEKLKKAIASSATPEAMKEKMREKLSELEKEDKANDAMQAISDGGGGNSKWMEALSEMAPNNPHQAKKIWNDLNKEKKAAFKKHMEQTDAADEGNYEGFLYLIGGNDKKQKKEKSKPKRISGFDIQDALNGDFANDKKLSEIIEWATKEGWVRRISHTQAEWTKEGIDNYDVFRKGGIADKKGGKEPKKKARGVKEAMDQAKPKNISGKSKSFEEQFEELKKQDKGKLKLLCEEVMKKSEERKAKAKESTKDREAKDESTRAVDAGIKTASALTTLAEKADLSEDKQKQFLELMAVIAGIKKVLGGGALSKEQKEAFKDAVNLED